MKKLFLAILAMVLVLAMVGLAFAGQKTVNFSWSQTIPPTNDLAGWKLYQAATSGGPYTETDIIPFTTAQDTYSFSKMMDFPDNAITTFYFVILAYRQNGNPSQYSTEMPGGPVDLIFPVAPVWKVIIIAP